jgi:hypothetical protein
MANVRIALIHGLNRIFVASAVIMTLAIVLSVMLKSVALRGRAKEQVEQPAVH